MSHNGISQWFDSSATANESLGHDLGNAFAKIFDISRKSTWPVTARLAKGTEEIGELGTAVLVEQGFIKHKTLQESSIGETADTIICVLDVMFASYPETSREDLIRSLTNELFTKSTKWNKIVDDLNATEMRQNCRSACAKGPAGACIEGCISKQMKF